MSRYKLFSGDNDILNTDLSKQRNNKSLEQHALFVCVMVLLSQLRVYALPVDTTGDGELRGERPSLDT